MSSIGKARQSMILSHVTDEPQTIEQIAQRCGLSPKTVKFALLQLREEGAVERVGGTYKAPLFRRVAA